MSERRRVVLVEGTAKYRIAVAVVALVVLAIAIAIPYVMPPFRVFQFTEVLMIAIAVLGLNLLTGYNGQISLGHSAFFALGAYTTTVLIIDHGWNYVLTLPLAFAVAFAAGFLVGIPALRLHGLYLALVTLSLAIVTPPLIKRFEGVTGGAMGRSVPKPGAPGWTGLAQDQWHYFVVLAITAVMVLIARNLVSGRIGRALRAVRDDGLAAETMGVDLAIFKTLTFAYSAGFAGVAGGIFAFVVGFVSPESFTLVLAIGFLSAMVVGGLSSISGAVFGSLFYVFVPVYAADVNDALSGVIYGVALIVVMFLMPAGVVGVLRRVRGLVVDVRKPGAHGPTVAPPVVGRDLSEAAGVPATSSSAEL
ncbi:MAG TPA: branched-chain amino acid ABC transporter permease [Acidimicrobiales bacterium]|nr:branched-chain amino acid ABC transporter permease [Acidimicrobiales bacterium]